jgi:conjugal transfer pilus assembly protein TraD
MAADPNSFEFPWRPNVEMSAALTWGAAAVASLGLSLLSPQPMIGIFSSAVCIGAGVARGVQAYKREVVMGRLNVDGVEFITPPELIAIARKASASESYWLGKGFPWTDIQATRLHHVLAEGPVKVLGNTAMKTGGAWWVQGLSKEEDLVSELANMVGHTVVSGTTRVGKTRYADLQIGQAIVRGETVVVFDPKNEGMHGLAGNMKKMCEELGCPERFVYFNFAFPETSVRIDPLRNYTSPTELASRIAPLVPSDTGNDPFTSFAWDVLNAQTLGMIFVGEKPTLKRYRVYTESGVANLLLRAVLKDLDDTLGADWDATVLMWAKNRGMLKGKQGDDGDILVRQSLNLLLAYYFEDMVPKGHSNEAIEALAVIHKHPAEHTAKMIANLRPILTKLTTGTLGDLLSPDPLDVSDPRGMTDMQSLINSKAVVYVGLNSLADSAIGSAIGSILLSDLAAVAGNRNNYNPHDKSPINVHLDEASEILNNPTIQLMNKGGGSGFRVTIYTQTFADFAARLGSEYKARQVLANANNRVSFRVLDAETQQYIVDGIPSFKLKTLSMRYGTNVTTRIHDEFTSSYQEAIVEEEADLFPSAMLGELPPLHFIARLSGGRMIKGRIPILKVA